MGAIKDNIRIIVVWVIVILIGLLLCMGCTKVIYKPVNVPVPVPCIKGEVKMMPVALSDVTEGDVAKLLEKGDYSFFDDIYSTLVILKTDRQNMKDRLDACK